MEAKLLELQVKLAEALTNLTRSQDTLHEKLADIAKILQAIDSHFSNGFRADIKDALSKEIAEDARILTIELHKVHKQHEQTLDTINSAIQTIKSPKNWIGAFLFLASIFGAVAGIVTVVMKLIP